MKIKEFNTKWKNYIEEGHYGFIIHDEAVADYLDKEFTEEIKHNPDFKFSQIKIKWNQARLYSNSHLSTQWENEINKIMNNGDEPSFGFNK